MTLKNLSIQAVKWERVWVGPWADSINVKKTENCTNPLLNGHKAGELWQDGELFAQLDDEALQLCFLALEKKNATLNTQSSDHMCKSRWLSSGLTQWHTQTHLMFSFIGVQASVFEIPYEGPCCELVEKLSTH